MHEISQKAINHIIAEEVSSPAYYERHYRRPEWPGGASGVTVGNGYDLGYASRQKIADDFGPHVSAGMLSVMQSCSGIRGGAASARLAGVRNQIDIPWPVAYDVFLKRDVPQWTATVYKALGSNCDFLTPTCLGIEVGLAYNRGAGGFNSPGDRYVEMRAIKADVVAKRFTDIPDQHDKMARLWVGTSVAGVAGRRHREAKLFREGLKETPADIKTVPVPTVEPEPDVIDSNRPDQRARTPQPKTTPAQHGTAASVGAGPPAAAKQAGFSDEAVALIAGLSIAAAIVVWVLWYRNRNPTGGFPSEVKPATGA